MVDSCISCMDSDMKIAVMSELDKFCQTQMKCAITDKWFLAREQYCTLGMHIIIQSPIMSTCLGCHEIRLTLLF